MRLATFVLVLAAITISCDRETKTDASSKAATVVYRSPDGRAISEDDLKNVSGKFNYEVVGGEDIPAQVQALHEQGRAAGSAGEYDKAIDLLRRAAEAAPRWPYPVYDMAHTYLLKEDPDNALVYYRKTLQLSPRGFFTAITALDTLEREKAGEFKAGLYLAYLSLEWMDDAARKADIVRQLTELYPGFAPAWKELALMTDNNDERLAAKPDAETKGMLLINKALTLNQLGKRDQAVELLGQLALDPQSTFSTEHLAKASLRNFMDTMPNDKP